MYEELYEALPDVNRYASRIEIDLEGKDRNRAFLDDIVFSHQRNIPFENLDICDFKQPPSLGIIDMYEKIITGKRGGYCFELNALFDAFLQTAGFSSTPCLSRSLKNYGYTQPIMHRGTIVSLEGERVYCDVGYGGPLPACSIPLEDGFEFTSRDQLFRIDAAGHGWWHVSYCGSAASDAEARQPLPVIAFLDEAMDTVDFVPLAHFASTHPNSVFTQRRLVNRRTNEGNVSITADQFTCINSKGKQTKTVESEEDFRALLTEHFGITLP